jgi:hypothetical protein
MLRSCLPASRSSLLMLLATIVAAVCVGPSYSADNVTVYKIQNRWKQFIYEAGANVGHDKGGDDAKYRWVLEDTPAGTRIKNLATGAYLAAAKGATQAKLIQPAGADALDSTSLWTSDVVAAQAALETLPVDAEGKLLETPEIRSDNGSCYISREFGAVLDEHELSHRRIKPHCPEENGLMERANRTIGEALEGEELTDYLQASRVICRLIRWYNEQRLNSALGFLRPVDYYRGDPEAKYAVRRQKLAEARHRRREKNLQLRQPTLPFTTEETVA